jgi:hypothetical protein
MRRALFLALAAALCLASAAAQEQGGPRPAPKPVRVFLTVRGDDQGAVAEAYASLGTSLVSSPLVLAVLTPPSSAEASLCRILIEAELGASEEGAVASWEIRAAGAAAALSRGEATRVASSPAWSDASFWEPLSEGLEAAIAAMPPDLAIVAGRPGTAVSGIGADFSIPEGGEIEVPVEIPSLLAWKATAPGSYPESGSALVEAGGSRIEIPHRPLPQPARWAIDSSLYGFAFPEFRLSYALSPSWALRATITQFALGLSFSNAYSKDYPPLLYSTRRRGRGRIA